MITRDISIIQLTLSLLLLAIMWPVTALSKTTPSLSIELFSIKAGETKEMLIDLNNPDDVITLVQFDLRLPTGLSIAVEDGELAVDIAGRTTWKKHSLTTNWLEDKGVTRFMLHSSSNAAITGTSGAVISIKLTAASGFDGGNIKLEGQVLVCPDATATTTRPADYTYTIAAAPKDDVTLTAKSYTRVYGNDNPAFEYTVSDGTITSGTPKLSCSATKTSPVGTYDILIEKGTVSNNTVKLVKGTLTITKAPLTISAGNYTKMEGEDNPTFTPTFSGFKNSETKTVLTKQPTVTTTATKNSPAGSYTVTVSGAEAQNYNFTYQNGTLTVNPKPVVGDILTFNNATVKAICVQNWDTNGDGELSKEEAAAVTSLGTVFKGNTEITRFDELQYFTGLTVIENATFQQCTNLERITLPADITEIGTTAFALTAIKVMSLPFKLKTIRRQAFYGCGKMLAVNIPASVTNIEKEAFVGCYGVTFNVSPYNSYYDGRDECNAIIETETNTLIAGGYFATIPASVKHIGDAAMTYCWTADLVLPDGLETIGENAFWNSTRMESLTIPSTVTRIGSYAFEDCNNLKTVTSKIERPFAINDNVFSTNTYNGTLNVPYGTKSQYQGTAGWKNFTNIKEESIDGIAETMNNASLDKDVQYYTLDGRKLQGQPTKKGVYIVNGRKVVVE